MALAGAFALAKSAIFRLFATLIRNSASFFSVSTLVGEVCTSCDLEGKAALGERNSAIRLTSLIGVDFLRGPAEQLFLQLF